jgi:nucleotide-binding universal stress UspA family protein
MKNILVALDFSESNIFLIREAEKLGKAFQSKLWLIHIASPEPDFLGYETGPKTVRHTVAERFRNEHRQLQSFAEELRQKVLDVVALLIQGATVQTLLEEAKKLEIDLIIIGSHGRTGFYKALMGSISEGILHKANCPVLVIPTHT